MASANIINSTSSAEGSDSSVSTNVRGAFLEWLSTGNSKKFPPEVLLSCMDRISDYAIQKKMSTISIWDYARPIVFNPLYKKLIDAKLLRITDRNTHKVFIVAGQLYLRFLKEKPFARKDSTTSVVDKEVRLATVTPKGNINTDDVVACQEVGDKVDSIDLDSQCVEIYKVGGEVQRTVTIASSAVAVQPAFTSITKKHERTENIALLLSEHFPYGFRLESPIELMRFRQLFSQKFVEDDALPDDNTLKCIIATCGMLFDGKVYIVGKKTEELIKAEVDTVLQNGEELIFYDVFYDYHREWLFAESVMSEAQLRGILERLYPHFSFKQNYFSTKAENGNENAKIGQEILDVWGDGVLMSYEQLAARLLYIPFGKLKYALAANDNFIRNATGVYTHTAKIDLYDDERQAICDYVENACRKNGYASLSDLPTAEFEERNYELSTMAVNTAICNMCLADKYQRKGQIVFRLEDELDALTLMREYCRSLDHSTLKELRDYQYELIEDRSVTVPMRAGYEEMVRTDEDTFISEQYIHFDREAIDNALDLFVVGGDYIPIKSITTFAAFPYCGQAWNLFLLESYLWRFSGRYRLVQLSANSANAGVVVRKSCDWSLDEIMVDAVASSGVPLEQGEVLEYLCSNGYIARRKYNKVNEIIEQARIGRGKGD